MTNNVYLQSATGEIIPLPLGGSTLGRESSNQIVVNDPALSRQHLSFRREADQVWLTDLNSANGTFVNDYRLAANQLYPLNHGDRISLGGRVTYTIYGVNPAANASDIAGTMRLSDLPAQPAPTPDYSPAPPYVPPPAAPQYMVPVPYPAYYAAPVGLGKPGKVQSIAILCLIDGILNLLWGLSLTCSAIASLIGILLLPLTIYPIILGILEIIYASQLLPDAPKVQKPAQYLAIMQIVNIITGDIISVVIGIISLIFYSDTEVQAYFNTLPGRSAYP